MLQEAFVARGTEFGDAAITIVHNSGQFCARRNRSNTEVTAAAAAVAAVPRDQAETSMALSVMATERIRFEFRMFIEGEDYSQ